MLTVGGVARGKPNVPAEAFVARLDVAGLDLDRGTLLGFHAVSRRVDEDRPRDQARCPSPELDCSADPVALFRVRGESKG